MPRNPSLAKIHIAKKQLGLDDDTYRAMLQQHGGVSSAKDLTPLGAAKVLHHLEKAGFKPKASPGKRPKPAAGRAAWSARSKRSWRAPAGPGLTSTAWLRKCSRSKRSNG